MIENLFAAGAANSARLFYRLKGSGFAGAFFFLDKWGGMV